MTNNQSNLYQLNTKGSVLLKNVNVVDIISGDIHHAKNIMIQNGMIVSIHQLETNFTGHNIIDLQDSYIIPGLWDMHTHISANSEFAFPMFLSAGVTGVRDCGTPFENIREWKKMQGIRPRIIYSGPIADGTWKNITPPFRRFAMTPSDGHQAVHEVMDNHADFFKTHNKLSRDVFLACAEECRANGVMLAGHVPYAVSAHEAVKNGQKSIEHMTGIFLSCSDKEETLRNQLLESDLNSFAAEQINYNASQSKNDQKYQKLVQLMKEKDVYVTPTLVAYKTLCTDHYDESDERFIHIPENIRTECLQFNQIIAGSEQLRNIILGFRDTFHAYCSLATELFNAGIPLLCGTDSTLCPGFIEGINFYGTSIWEELELLVANGLSPLQALQSATINPARFLSLEDHSGQIKPDMQADLVILNQNPLENISNIRSVCGVILNGIYLSAEDLSRNLPVY